MIEQRVSGPKLQGIRGVLLIAIVALAVFLGSAFFDFLGRYIGNTSSLLFIVYGILIAWLLMDYYVQGFIYTCQNGCIRVCRTYGKRERHLTDIWLNGVKAFGAPEEMKARFPEAKAQRATKRNCSLKTVAVVYNDAGQTAMLLMQPDAPLMDVLSGALKH